MFKDRRNSNKVALLVYGTDFANGGISRYTLQLRDAFDSIGIRILSLWAGQYNSDHKFGNTVGLPGSGRLPGLMTYGQLQIASKAIQKKFELVHDPTGTAPLLPTIGTHKIVTIHDVIPYIYPDTSTTLDWLIYRFWLPLAVRRLDAIITDSNQSKEDIVRFLPVKEKKVTVVPLAASEAYCPLPDGEIERALEKYGIRLPYILYVGALESRKNLPGLLEAYAWLRHWSNEWTLVIVGARKWKYAPIFETTQRLGLEPYVHFTGYVEEEDLPALYNGADLFVFPSLYEGFGLPVLEAMACGTPVVTSNTSSLPEVVGDAALLVDPYNVEEIAASMRLVLEDKVLATDLRERGLARANEFTWERTARETITVYEKVLGRKLL